MRVSIKTFSFSHTELGKEEDKWIRVWSGYSPLTLIFFFYCRVATAVVSPAVRGELIRFSIEPYLLILSALPSKVPRTQVRSYRQKKKKSLVYRKERKPPSRAVVYTHEGTLKNSLYSSTTMGGERNSYCSTSTLMIASSNFSFVVLAAQVLHHQIPERGKN